MKYKRRIVRLRKLYRWFSYKPQFSAFSMLLLAILVVGPNAIKWPPTSVPDPIDEIQLGYFPIVEPTLKYGLALDTFQVFEGTIRSNQFLSDILLPYKVDLISIENIANNANEIFPVTKLRAGKGYTILSRDTAIGADYFVYEPDVYRYVLYGLKAPFTTTVVEREVDIKINTVSGIVTSSLWNSMTDNGLSQELTAKMEDALAWSIDFYHILKGDQFKLIYEEKSIDGQTVGVGKILGAYYKNADNEYYAYYYENDNHKGFFDEQGRSMKKAFLKAPVKFSRISSRYNPRRFHPVLKRVRPHYGTDYSAPKGTPIYAVADGVVTKAGYGKGNGNYVKIRHDKIYQTQYLHMSRFAKGMRSGVHVKQGQVIGYVGSTGLATGPHVCFRFWKNGRQVNHLRMNLPPPDPMPEEDLPKFFQIRDDLNAQLKSIPINSKPEQLASTQSVSLP